VACGAFATLIVISIICAFTWYKLKSVRRNIPDADGYTGSNVVESTAAESTSGNLNNSGNDGAKRESARLMRD
jgi:hypothetical protein